eukprot:797775_1
MNLNVVLRHELHALINRASADQLFVALHSPQSPIRDRFIRFLALSYADWLSTQNDIDDDDIKKEWKHALKMQPNGFTFAGLTNGNSEEHKSDKDSISKPSVYNSTDMKSNNNNGLDTKVNGHMNKMNGGVDRENGNIEDDNKFESNNNIQHRLQLNEKKPLDGAMKLWTESDDTLKKQLNKIITQDMNFQKLTTSIQIQNDYSTSMLSDTDDSLIDQISTQQSPPIDTTPTTPTSSSIEQENMRKYFNMLTNEQQSPPIDTTPTTPTSSSIEQENMRKYFNMLTNEQQSPPIDT